MILSPAFPARQKIAYRMDAAELQQFWSIPGPWSIVPITQGVNNLTLGIETPAGSYILRSYRSDRSLKQIRYELSVLKSLQGESLPFQIPVPIPTVTGELFAVQSGTILSLSPRLPGSPPPNDNLDQTYAAGQALAELVKALAVLEVERTSHAASFPPLGEFEAWTGIPIDPANLLRELPLTEEERKQILTFVETTRASASSLYRRLPQQIIHRDYDQSNVLMQGNTVTGVLDFEFCGPDLRVLDLTYALFAWPYGLWGSGKEWAVLDAFGRGYARQQRLTSAELEALPRVLRLRATAGLFFHGGRFVQRVETAEEFLERIRETLRGEAWLQFHAEKLVKHAHTWHAGL